MGRVEPASMIFVAALFAFPMSTHIMLIFSRISRVMDSSFITSGAADELDAWRVGGAGRGQGLQNHATTGRAGRGQGLRNGKDPRGM